MIYAILIIDEKTGLPLVEYYPGGTSPTEIDYMDTLHELIDTYRSTFSNINQVHRSDTSKILMEDEFSIVLHYFAQGSFLICAIAQTDDETQKIFEILQILARRFWLKHQMELKQFRIQSLSKPITSFIVDMEIYSQKGHAAEIVPKLIVSDKTLQRLQEMSMITNKEFQVAKLCKDQLSPYKIAKKIPLRYEDTIEILKKLSSLDICKY